MHSHNALFSFSNQKTASDQKIDLIFEKILNLNLLFQSLKCCKTCRQPQGISNYKHGNLCIAKVFIVAEKNKMRKQEAEIWYEIRSPACPRPFYCKKKENIVAWSMPYDAILYNPPDGFNCDPPGESLMIEEAKDNDSEPMTLTSRIGSFSSANLKLSKSQFILDSNAEPYGPAYADVFSCEIQEKDGLLNIPYFPDDIFLLLSKPAILNYLKENLEEQTTGLTKQKLDFTTIIRPGKKSLSNPILKDSSRIPNKNLCTSIFKAIRSYISSSNSENSINEITKLIEGSSIQLVDEAVVQLITEANSCEATSTVVSSWHLLLYIGARYMVSEKIRSLIRSFSFLVATSVGVDLELVHLAELCLLRFSSRSPVNARDMTPMEFLKYSTSLTALFGFSISEALFKESLRKLEHDTNVPQILKKIAIRLRDLGAFTHEGIFRLSGSKSDKIGIINRINSGEWEIDSGDVDTTASIMTAFFSMLRDSVIPPDQIRRLGGNSFASNRAIATANSLSNESRDTLMFFIGFIQELVPYEPITKMTIQNFDTSFHTILSRIPEPTDLMMVKNDPNRVALGKVFRNLIEYWRTDEVYQPLMA